MKKLLICMLVLGIAMSGCSSQRVPNENSSQVVPAPENMEPSFQYDQPLTVDDVKLAFDQSGLSLIEAKDIEPQKYMIDQISPSIFSINDTKQILHVYIFEDTMDRKQVIWEGGDHISLPTVFTSLPQGFLTASFVTRNVIIIDRLDLRLMNNIPSSEEQVLRKIESIENALNNSQLMVFIAKSQNWDAQYLVEYYQHWYKDTAGLTRVDQSAVGKWSVKYIGPNPESIQGIKYALRTPTGRGSGSRRFTKDGEDYYLGLPKDTSSSIPTSNSECMLTITWLGQEETLTLHPIFY